MCYRWYQWYHWCAVGPIGIYATIGMPKPVQRTESHIGTKGNYSLPMVIYDWYQCYFSERTQYTTKRVMLPYDKVRLQENLTQSENGQVQLTEIKAKAGDSYTSHELGRTINKVFKGLIVKRRRDKHDWTKITYAYLGLGWKECEEQSCTLQDITSLAPRELFPLDQCTTHIKLGHFNGSSLNGNKLMTELTFHSSGMLEYVVCGKSLQPQNLKISDRFDFNVNSVKSVFETVMKLQLCEGLHENKIPSTYSYNTNRAIRELRSMNGSDVTPRIRSFKCEVVIPFLSRHVACEHCRKVIHEEKVETEEESCDTAVTLTKKLCRKIHIQSNSTHDRHKVDL